jgi:hypothetical protein
MIRKLLSAIAVTAVIAVGFIASAIAPEAVPGLALSEVAISPVEQPSACPGSLKVPVGDIESIDPAIDATSDDREREVYAAGDSTPTADGDGAIVDAPLATSVERVGAGDIAGLAAVTCTRPLQDQWLVGGSTALSSSARLVITNPGLASAEVTVSLFGPVGEVEQRAVVVIGAQTQREVLLEGVESEVPALVVRVEATGAGVVAALQDSRVDGFQPAGTDWIGPTAGPADALVVPGVGVRGADAADVESSLRLLSPEGAVVTLTLVTDEGIVAWGGTTDLRLEPGVVADIAVPAGEAGVVEIDAEGDVLAAAVTAVAREATEGLEGARAFDRGWVAGQDHRDGLPRSLVVPAGLTEVVVYSPLTDTFVLHDAEGAVVAEQPVAARSLARIPLDVPPGTVVTAEGAFSWALHLRGNPGFLSSLTPELTEMTDVEITVAVDSYVPGPVP